MRRVREADLEVGLGQVPWALDVADGGFADERRLLSAGLRVRSEGRAAQVEVSEVKLPSTEPVPAPL